MIINQEINYTTIQTSAVLSNFYVFEVMKSSKQTFGFYVPFKKFRNVNTCMYLFIERITISTYMYFLSNNIAIKIDYFHPIMYTKVK